MINQKAFRLPGFLVSFILTVLMILFSGCSTLVGTYIGSTIDKDPSNETIPRLNSLEPGARLNLTMNDSTVVAGRFVRMAAILPSVYLAKYDSAR